METNYDVVVLGVGGMGSATVAELARRGAKVCGVERHGPAHDQGSSHGQTRIIRKGYLEHPDYVPLLHRAYALWDRLEEESGPGFFERCGLVAGGPPGSRVVAGQEACYREHDLPHEQLEADELSRRYPQLRLPEGWTAFFDPFGGFLRVEECVQRHLDMARERGAVLHFDEHVLNWKVDGGGVEVVTDQRTLHAGRLVITAGAWAAPLLRDLGVEIEIWRKVLFWYEGAAAAGMRPDAFPCFMISTDTGADTVYGFPAVDPWGLKVAEHNIFKENVERPEDIERGLRPGDEKPVADFLARFIPGQWQRSRHAVCMYTMTPDEHFVLDRHPSYEQIIIGGGFSGHGFKFASVIGEILADLALEGNTGLPIDFLRLARFGGD